MPDRPSDTLRIALVAHDAKKDLMVDFARAHLPLLKRCAVVATGTTGGRLRDALGALNIEPVKSGPLGGDQQIGARIADGEIDALIFFVDPLSPLPHDVDVKALTRLALVYDVPLALNPATGDAILSQLVSAALPPSH